MQNKPSGLSVSSKTPLQGYIDRIEIIEQEKRELMQQIRDVYNELKHDGFDVKIVRMLIRLRRMRPHEIVEEEMLLDAYKQAVGMIAISPAGSDKE